MNCRAINELRAEVNQFGRVNKMKTNIFTFHTYPIDWLRRLWVAPRTTLLAPHSWKFVHLPIRNMFLTLALEPKATVILFKYCALDYEQFMIFNYAIFKMDHIQTKFKRSKQNMLQSKRFNPISSQQPDTPARSPFTYFVKKITFSGDRCMYIVCLDTRMPLQGNITTVWRTISPTTLSV